MPPQLFCRAITPRMLRERCFSISGKDKEPPEQTEGLSQHEAVASEHSLGSGPRVVIRNAPGIPLCHANVQLFKAFAVVPYSNVS